MSKAERSPIALVGAIMMIAAAVLRIIVQLSNDFLPIPVIIFALGFALVGIAMLVRVNIVGVIGAIAIAAVQLYWIFDVVRYSYGYFDGWSFATILYYLGIGVAFMILMVMMLKGSPTGSGSSKMLGIVGGIIAFVGYIPLMIINRYWYFSAEGIPTLLVILLEIAAIFVAGLAMGSTPVFFKPGAKTAGVQPVPRYYPGQYPQGQYPQGQYPQGQFPSQPGQYGQPVTPNVQQVRVEPVSRAIPDVQPIKAQPVIPDIQPVQPATSETDKISTLRQYKELLDAGVITEEEFSNMKKQILG